MGQSEMPINQGMMNPNVRIQSFNQILDDEYDEHYGKSAITDPNA